MNKNDLARIESKRSHSQAPPSGPSPSHEDPLSCGSPQSLRALIGLLPFQAPTPAVLSSCCLSRRKHATSSYCSSCLSRLLKPGKTESHASAAARPDWSLKRNCIVACIPTVFSLSSSFQKQKISWPAVFCWWLLSPHSAAIKRLQCLGRHYNIPLLYSARAL